MTLPRRLPVALACLCLLSFTACQHDDEPTQTVFHTAGSTPVKVKTPQTTQIPDDQALANATPPPPPERHTEPTSPAGGGVPPKVDYPYAVPVQGKPGFVQSPYAPDSGYVDVHGFTPGQEVRDPYTQKIFLVP